MGWPASDFGSLVEEPIGDCGCPLAFFGASDGLCFGEPSDGFGLPDCCSCGFAFLDGPLPRVASEPLD